MSLGVQGTNTVSVSAVEIVGIDETACKVWLDTASVASGPSPTALHCGFGRMRAFPLPNDAARIVRGTEVP